MASETIPNFPYLNAIRVNSFPLTQVVRWLSVCQGVSEHQAEIGKGFAELR